MWAISHRVVNTNTTAIEINAIQFLDASSGIFNSSHLDETEPTRAV